MTDTNEPIRESDQILKDAETERRAEFDSVFKDIDIDIAFSDVRYIHRVKFESFGSASMFELYEIDMKNNKTDKGEEFDARRYFGILYKDYYAEDEDLEELRQWAFASSKRVLASKAKILKVKDPEGEATIIAEIIPTEEQALIKPSQVLN